eukprot:7091227-Prorocentrum_lima.AAC.1
MRRRQCLRQLVRRLVHGEGQPLGTGTAHASPTVSDPLTLDSSVTGGVGSGVTGAKVLLHRRSL